MVLLVFRVAAAPVLVLAASGAQRRFGQSVSGRFVGLPLTSLPLLALLAAADGLGFAASAATAALAGVAAQCVWALAYALAARRHGPAWAATVATGAFGAACAVLMGVHLGLAPATMLAAASVVGSLAVWPAGGAARPPHPATRREVGGRMVAGSAFTVGVTGASGSVGPQAAGFLGSFPVLTVVMAVATHRRDGAGAATDFLDGVVAGTLSVVAALATLAATLTALGPLAAFPLALGASLATQVVPTGWARPGRRAAASAQAGSAAASAQAGSAAASTSTSRASAPCGPQVSGLTSSPATVSPSSAAIDAIPTMAAATASRSHAGAPR